MVPLFTLSAAVKESSSLSLSEEFPKLLGDSSHLLRTYMASAIKVLFVRHVTNASAVPAPRDHQYEMFERVAQILVQSLTETAAVSKCYWSFWVEREPGSVLCRIAP